MAKAPSCAEVPFAVDAKQRACARAAALVGCPGWVVRLPRYIEMLRPLAIIAGEIPGDRPRGPS